MQYSQEHLKTMVYAEFGGQTECIMGNSKIENTVVAVCYVNETNIFNWFSWRRLSEWRFVDRYHTQRRDESFI